MQHFRAILGVFVALAASSSHQTLAAEPADHVSVNGNFLEAFNAAGDRVWRYRTTGPIQMTTRRDGNFELNGHELVSRNGRLLERLNDNAGAGASLDLPGTFSTAAEMWSPAVEMMPDSLLYIAPAFDAAGNAYAAVDDGDAGGGTIVMKSNPATGVWTPISSYFNVAFWSGTMTVDPQGDITLACYCSAVAGQFQVQVARYEPATGWAGPTTVYSEPPVGATPGVNISSAYDANGDVVIGTDISTYGAASFFYSNTAKKWSGPTQIPLPLTTNPQFEQILMSELSGSPNGKYIQFSYVVLPSELNPPQGLYTNALNLNTGVFGSPVLVPKTAQAVKYNLSQARFPAFIDNGGNFTTVWDKGKRGQSCMASRFNGKKWSTTKIADTFLGFYTDFYGQTMDANGDILLDEQQLLPSTDGDAAALGVYEYKVGSGWSYSLAATWTSFTSVRQRIAWLGTSGKAVASFMPMPVANTDPAGLSSTIWNGSSWSTPVQTPPGNQFVLLQEIASDVSGNVVLNYNPGNPQGGSGTSFATNDYGTFMTP